MSSLGRLALGTLLLLAPGCGGSERPRRIVLVTIDTLRADGLSEATMPRTSAFLEEGLLFPVSFASTTTTQPTHATLLTGLPPWAHGVTRNGVVLAPERETLAERLHEQGYETHAVVASFPLDRRFGFDQGFDSYVDTFDVPYVRVWEGEPTESGRFYSLGETVTREALDAIDAAGGPRQFFWFHYFDPHDPYGDAAGEPYPIQKLLALAAQGSDELAGEARKARARYDADLRALDANLASLFARLRADADAVDTLVVFTADHGESFGERGALGHGKRLTPEQVHVPLGFVGPGFPAARRDELTGSEDVARTVLSWAGVEAEGFGGRDLRRASGTRVLLGMRRTFAEPKEEVLTDGSARRLPERLFYLARPDGLWSGNGSAVWRDDDPARPETGAEAVDMMRALAALERALEHAELGEELLDEEAQAALGALGYAR